MECLTSVWMMSGNHSEHCLMMTVEVREATRFFSFFSSTSSGFNPSALNENTFDFAVLYATALEACVKLEALLLDGNKLTAWPLPTSGGLANALPLRELNLARNLTLHTAPPGAFARTPLLQKLDLSYVTVPFAPSGFLAPLTKLRELRWAKGGLTQIPDDVYRMEDLRILRLPDNKIFSLSVDVARLTKLNELDLTNNDLATLPAELGTLPLRALGVEGNMLRMIRRPIIERGEQVVLAHRSVPVHTTTTARVMMSAEHTAMSSTKNAFIQMLHLLHDAHLIFSPGCRAHPTLRHASAVGASA